MEVIRSSDNMITKYVHLDGSETIIKSNSSCSNALNLETGSIDILPIERNKFSVFISSSYGCPLGCKFCYLTSKKTPYVKLSNEQIIENVKEALVYEANINPLIRRRYIKLSWMCMGDAFLMHPLDLRITTEKIISFAIRDYGCATGLDGVDISTIFPKNNDGWPHQLATMNDRLFDNYRINKHNDNRSIVRLFYSLHSPINRKEIIPASRFNSPIPDLTILNKFKKWYGIDVIIHHMFLEDINDSNLHLDSIKYLTDAIIKDTEFRVLRFNDYEGSKFKESYNFDSLIVKYSKELGNVKYQISNGRDIKASCGMFNI
jgi:adenine C2-methylase RlmN of 23S rRNA A2503 and tRNA A37